MTVSAIGPVVSRGNVTQAVLTTLAAWLETYLADLERQNGLNLNDVPRPPTPESVHGALDFLAWRRDLTPEVIVIAEPYGEAELFGEGQYSQWYEVQIGTVIVTDDESTSTQIADIYGAAIEGCIAGNGDLSGLAERTRMIVASKTEFEDAAVRGVQRSVVVFRTLIENVVSETTRPAVPVPDGQLPPEPFDATSANLTVIGIAAP